VRTATRPSQASARVVPRITERFLKPISSLLKTGDPAETVDRLFSSQHVKDLQLIIAAALGAVLLVLFIGSVLSFEDAVYRESSNFPQRKSDWIFVGVAFAAIGNFLKVFAPVLAVFGAVLAWAYQVGSARLGVVDLFACEISTLCRVAVVVETVHRYIDKFNKGPRAQPAGAGEPQEPVRQFTSQEDYFPVFESSARDLQTLEARVVINITAFYTYMKAVRDMVRALAQISPLPGESESPSNEPPGAGSWHEAVRNVIYMLFLAMESARHAITDLVEFEPEKAERTIVILISELEAYRFLCGQFTDEQDIFHRRLMLRKSEYRDVAQELCRSVKDGRNSEKTIDSRGESRASHRVSQWEPAWQLLPELERLYKEALNSINP
jgi:hypothetical protein